MLTQPTGDTEAAQMKPRRLAAGKVDEEELRARLLIVGEGLVVHYPFRTPETWLRHYTGEQAVDRSGTASSVTGTSEESGRPARGRLARA